MTQTDVGLTSVLLQVSLNTFNQVKQVLDEAQTKYVRRYHVCPNDCIVYYNSANFEQEYRHEHRTRYKTARTRRCSDVGLCLPDVSGCNRRRKHVGMYMHCRSDVVFILDFRCPVCNTGRYVVDPTDNNLRPAKVIFFFPLAPFVRSLFSRPDMVPHLYTDADGRPEGHVTRSRGFQRKLHDNPHLNQDHRNLGLVGTTDGVPFFNDQRRGAWPFILRCANLPDTLSMHMSNCHLHLLSANEYWELDKDAGVLRRRIRAPKSLHPHLVLVVDDLLHAYHKGTFMHAPVLVRVQFVYVGFVPTSFRRSVLFPTSI